jgi:hypothetical protein
METAAPQPKNLTKITLFSWWFVVGQNVTFMVKDIHQGIVYIIRLYNDHPEEKKEDELLTLINQGKIKLLGPKGEISTNQPIS